MNAETLKYRRQFFLGDEFVGKFVGWKLYEVGSGLRLTAHPDLEISQYSLGDKLITLIGYIINPYAPEKNSYEVTIDILKGVTNFNDVIKNTYHLSGRWAIIYYSEKELKMLHDPCGMRQIFYTNENNQVFCGSQPSILSEVLSLQEDEDASLREFANSKEYELSERFWIGDRTIYKNVKHLLPNHYLDLKKAIVARYWLNQESPNHENIDIVVKEAANLLKGSIKGITKRQKSMLAVTAGWDSRVLLAASKNIKDELKYFVSTKNVLKSSHMDIAIPLKLSRKLNLNLDVIDKIPPLRKDFIKILKGNVTNARVVPKTWTIQYHLDNSERLNINGNGSEIVRSYYGEKHPKQIDSFYIANMINHGQSEYVKKSIQIWMDSISDFNGIRDVSIIDLFYWEHRMGNWGTMYQAEQDIAIEEFSPFNNRKLLMLLMGVDKMNRKSPDYIIYIKLIEYLWKDTLSEPINPVPATAKFKKIISSLIPKSIKRNIKSIVMK